MSVSKTVQAAQRLLAERERVGVAKYGTTVDRTDLSPEQWLQHAIEEASDLLLYLIRLKQTMQPAPASSAGDPDRAAHLKRWESAPDWAQWLGEDDDGAAAWFDRKPRNHIIVGWHIEDGRAEPAPRGILGSVRCEPRPGAEGGA